jgi:hypothetical protein
LTLDAARLRLTTEKLTAVGPVFGRELAAAAEGTGTVIVRGIPLSEDGIGVVKLEVKVGGRLVLRRPPEGEGFGLRRRRRRFSLAPSALTFE